MQRTHSCCLFRGVRLCRLDALRSRFDNAPARALQGGNHMATATGEATCGWLLRWRKHTWQRAATAARATRGGTATLRPPSAPPPTAAEPLRGSTGSVVRALRRPAVTASIGLAVVATTAAGYQASDGHQTGQAGFTVSAEAIEQANELANTQIENDAQLASARNQANTSRAALQEKGRRRPAGRRGCRGPGPQAGRRAGRPGQGARGPPEAARGGHRAVAVRPQGRRPCAAARLRLGR